MTLEQALHYIHAVCWKGSIPGLERIEALLDKMGNPERACKFVHVAGTNGKGSTCAMLASIFQAAGYKTGLYTSPYILRFNERIQVNGQQIPDEAICELTEYIKPMADSIFEQPTEFEMVTALGFEYFKREKCDIVICEVGMGGEFDATNVIPRRPPFCATSVSTTPRFWATRWRKSQRQRPVSSSPAATLSSTGSSRPSRRSLKNAARRSARRFTRRTLIPSGSSRTVFPVRSSPAEGSST